MNKRINVYLSDDEVRLINWMANRYGLNFQEQMQQMFYLQLREDMEHYFDEMKSEKGEQL